MTSEHFPVAVEGSLAGGVQLLQYRNKVVAAQPADRTVAIGCELLDLCKQYQVPLLINDDLEFCAEIGAQGVHLGQRDVDCSYARARLGPEAIIGITRHDSPTWHKLLHRTEPIMSRSEVFSFSHQTGGCAGGVRHSVQGLQTTQYSAGCDRRHHADNGGSLIEAGYHVAVSHGLFGELDQTNVEDIENTSNNVLNI